MPKRSTTTRDKHRAAIARTQAPCAICGQPIDYTLNYNHEQSFVVDHIKPLARGGTDTINNKQAAHRNCNRNKAAKNIPTIMKRSQSIKRPHET